MRASKARTARSTGYAWHRRWPAYGGYSPWIPEVGAVCGKAARTDLCGGRPVMGVPTATEPPGYVIGRIERGRAGGDEAEMLGHAGQSRQQRERLERRHRVAALERVERHVEHGQVIGHEEGVEPGALQRLGEALEVGEVEVRVREGARITPGAGMDARRPHERAELQLTWHRRPRLAFQFRRGVIYRTDGTGDSGTMEVGETT